MLSPQERASAGLCFASRRLWTPTLAAIWPDDAPRGRAARLSAWLRDDPEALPRITHFHLLSRLIERAAHAGPEALGDAELRAICRQNVARARARLSATLAARPEAVLSALLGLDALHARSQNAACRYHDAGGKRERERESERAERHTTRGWGRGRGCPASEAGRAAPAVAASASSRVPGLRAPRPP